MHKHDVKRGAVVILVFLILINCAYIVHAFGISTPYLENETLKVNPEKSYTYTLTIQNGDDRDYYVDISYSSTNNIAKLREAKYYIPSNTYDNVFYFDITIPKEAKIGDRYMLSYGVKPRINNTDPVTLGVEIKRGIKILVVNDSTNAVSPIPTPEKKVEEKATNKIIESAKTIALATLIIILIIIIINRLWRLSKGISSRFSDDKVTDYTINEAKNLNEIKILLEKMNDDEFSLTEIKNIFKERIAELTTHNLTHEIKTMSRREVIRALDKIK